MKKILLTILIAFVFLSGNACAQRIELNIPVINFVNYQMINERTNIDFATGSLLSPLEAGFEVLSNDPENITVQFDVYATTTSGEQTAIKIKNNKNSGLCALANNQEIPTSSSIKNSLKSKAKPQNNSNTIGYDIEFLDVTSSDHPVYRNSDNAVVAYFEDDEYYKYYKVAISNNSSQLGKTFDRAYDEAGDYSLTIYCTITSN